MTQRSFSLSVRSRLKCCSACKHVSAGVWDRIPNRNGNAAIPAKVLFKAEQQTNNPVKQDEGRQRRETDNLEHIQALLKQHTFKAQYYLVATRKACQSAQLHCRIYLLSDKSAGLNLLYISVCSLLTGEHAEISNIFKSSGRSSSPQDYVCQLLRLSIFLSHWKNFKFSCILK